MTVLLMAAEKESGLRVIPFTMLMISLFKLIPDGKKAPLTPDLGVFSREHNDLYRQILAQLLNFAAEGKLKPLVAARIPLVEAARAHELLEHGRYAGKVVLLTGQQLGSRQ